MKKTELIEQYDSSPAIDKERDFEKICSLKLKEGIPLNETLLNCHEVRYQKNAKTIDSRKKDFKAEEKSRNRLINEQIPCFKYNYALDDSVQNFGNYQAYI